MALVQECCSHVHSFIEDLENFYGRDDLMDGEIMEALYENPFQWHKDDHENLQQDQDISTVEDEEILHLDSQQELHEMDQQYEEYLYTPSLEINEDNHCLSKRKQKVLSPLSEDEIDRLPKGQVIAQANASLQFAHGQESVGETSSSFENDDGLVISFVDQQTDNIFFHKDDKAVMFDNLKDCFLFKNDLQHIQTTEDHSIQDYFSDSSYVSCAEMLFQGEICSSTCSEFFEAHEHTFTEAHDEGRS